MTCALGTSGTMKDKILVTDHEGAKLRVTLDRRRGRSTSAIIRKIAEAEPAR